MASFELSKRRWNVYGPMYDEYIDLLVHKHVCKVCGRTWNLTPALVCKTCGKDFSKLEKNRIVAKKICADCKHEMVGNKTKCLKCGSIKLLNRPTCDECKGEVEMRNHLCNCGKKEYTTKFRSLQLKNSSYNKTLTDLV